MPCGGFCGSVSPLLAVVGLSPASGGEYASQAQQGDCTGGWDDILDIQGGASKEGGIDGITVVVQGFVYIHME